MAWVVLNKDYAINDETSDIVTRNVRINGFTGEGYRVSDDPVTSFSNRGRTYESLEARVQDRAHGGLRRVRLPVGMSYRQAVDAIRFYGEL